MTMCEGVIEQRITVRATAGQVWALVSVPGWFLSSHPAAPAVQKIDERLTLVHDDRVGLRVIRTLELIPPSYVAFRWEVPGESSLTPTLIQFWVTEQSAGTVLLKVRESGFTAQSGEVDEDLRTLEDNEKGWMGALEGVRRYFE
ncbi:hypothetical protein [[Micrococcus luteus] ATCC 49442]|jgi:hypothetical protein|uniref:hypothetical protein n=1 Tax=[Micrococcus luteus] ATCC 49442 TaxID=2698727 RepID=UPI0013D95B88|nr:hypothetical protein [[Micrococcus luteus] ATCC 49442]